jgi:ATPase subunit of ABC transporter with duplicated ATPase domains
VGYIDIAGVSYALPDGRPLLDEVSFRVGEGSTTALIGQNGAGKTTLLRIVRGEIPPHSGVVSIDGGLGVMDQFVGHGEAGQTVHDLLISVAHDRVRRAARELEDAEAAIIERDDLDTQMRYAGALADYAEAGGYEYETVWDTCTTAALGIPFSRARFRELSTLSGGEQKRLALEALLRGPADVLCLDEPDNYLDVPAKRWLERALASTPKAVLYVSHDREVIAATARRIVTVEARTAWTHGGGFAGYAEARRDRHARLAELRRRWDEEHERLRRLVARLRQQASISDALASRYQAAQTRLRKFEEAGPPPLPPREQRIAMRLRGGRTGVRAVTCRALAITGLVEPFDLEVLYGERVCVLGRNGSGKSHFLRLLAGEPVAHTGDWKLGARVVPGHFAQTHARPDLAGRPPLDALRRAGLDRSGAMASLSRYGLAAQAEQRFETLSGGQQARLQILLLETAGATLLLLDEPTDNLDLESAEALEDALDAFEGTVLAVTHDRWFARRFDRYAVFRADGRVAETAEPVWDDGAGDASRRRPARTA